MLVAAIIQRLRDTVQVLRTVAGALELAALLKANGLGQTGPAAHVVLLGERGGAVRNMAGGFVQDRSQTFGAVLSFRAADAARNAVAEITDELRAAVTMAIAGWQPAGASDCFALARGSALSVAPGTFAYTLEFSIADHLRISA